jgi:hypothetical protein
LESNQVLSNPWFQAIVGGLLTSAILALLSTIYLRSRGGWRSFRQFIGNSLRLQSAGVSYFIPSRTDFKHLKGGASITEYLSKLQKELIYVGFWHAKGIEHESIRNLYIELLRRGRQIVIVMLDPNCSPEILAGLSRHLAMTQGALVARLQESWRDMMSFQESLPPHLRTRFALLAHREILTASCQVIDRETPTAKALLDVKLYGQGREDTFAIELRPVGGRKVLYDRVVASYVAIYQLSHVPEWPNKRTDASPKCSELEPQ